METRIKVFSVGFLVMLSFVLSPWTAFKVHAAAPYYGASTVQLTVVSASEIDLSWTGVVSDPPVTGYEIQRESPIGSGYTTIVGNTNSVGTSYNDTNLSSGVAYGYRVLAINNDGIGPASANEAIATTFQAPGVQSPPNSPTGLTASPISASQITISWTAAQSASAVIGYRIDRGQGGSFTTIVTNTNTAVTSYTDSNLSAGVNYYYRVSAINSFGPSNPSASANATTFTLPSAPQNITAVTGSGQVTIGWQPPYFLGGGVTSYIITGASTTITVGGNVTSTVISGLLNQTPYYFSVKAANPAGQGPVVTSNPVFINAPPSSIAQPIYSVPTPTTPPAPVAIPAPTVTTPTTPTSPTTSTTSSFIFTSTLQVGSQNAAVIQLQERLTQEKVYSGPITGYFGALTRAAVELYQKDHGISPIGVVGPLTRSSLNAK